MFTSIMNAFKKCFMSLILGLFLIVAITLDTVIAQEPQSFLTTMNPLEESKIVFTVRDVGPGNQFTKLYIVWKDTSTTFNFELTTPNDNITAANDGDPCESSYTIIPGSGIGGAADKEVMFCKRTVIDALPEKVLGDVGDPVVEISINHVVTSAESWTLTIINTSTNRERVAFGITDPGAPYFNGIDEDITTISRFIQGSSTATIKHKIPVKIPKDPASLTFIDIIWPDPSNDLSVELILPNGALYTPNNVSCTAVNVPDIIGPDRYITFCRDHTGPGPAPNFRIIIGDLTAPVDRNENWTLVISSPLDKVEEINFDIDYGNFISFRKAIDVMLVLDRSGSMGGAKWSAALAAADLYNQLFYQFSVPQDKVGITHFTSEYVWDGDDINMTETIHPLQPLTNFNVFDLFAGIDPFEQTPIGEGLIYAMNQFVAIPSDHQKVILLLTDGWQNSLRDEDDFEAELALSSVPEIVKDMSIYSVAIGDETSVDEERINQLAVDHYGDYRRTENVVVLPQFYAQILGSILGEDLSVEINAMGYYPIPSGEEKAAFIITWQDRTKLLDISQLQRPGGAFITPSTTSFTDGGITHTVIYSNPELGDAYAYYIIEAPAGSSLPAGDWNFFNILDKTDPATPIPPTTPPQTFVLLQRNLYANFTVDQNVHSTGDLITLSAELREDINPVTGNDVEVYVELSGPDIGTGTFMAVNKLAKPLPIMEDKKLTKASRTERIRLDQSNPRLLHIKTLFDQLAWVKWPRTDDRIKLYDDGSHGDPVSGDGRWTGKFTPTKEGTYHFKFTAKGETPSGGNFSRTKTLSDHVKINVSPSKTGIDIIELPPEKYDIQKGWFVSRVNISPKDRYKGYLGPHYQQTINFVYDSKSVSKYGKIKDNLNGTYSQIFSYDPNAEPEVTIEVQNKKITTIPLVISHYTWELSGHLGYSIPQGTLSNNYDGSLSGMINLGYRFDPKLSAELLLGYHQFDNKNVGDDFYWAHTSLNAKYSYPVQNYKAFVNGGIGWYFPETGDDALGFNIGAGLLRSINERVAVELGYNYHKVSKGDLDEFSTIYLGIRYGF